MRPSTLIATVLLLRTILLLSLLTQPNAVNLKRDIRLYLHHHAHRNTSTPFDCRTNGTVLPVGTFIPRNATDPELRKKRTAIRRAVMHAWDAYAKSAWGFDELLPVSGEGVDTFSPGLGTTIVDSLSTLYIMGGLDGRYEAARNWVERHLDFSKVGQVIVFETVIRILGGLLSIFHLTGDRMYMQKAEELGVRLAASLDSPTGLPWPKCHLNETGRCDVHKTVGDSIYLAEVGSIQLEYRALAHHSVQNVIARTRVAMEDILEYLQRTPSSVVRLGGRHRSLLPFALSLSSGKWSTNLVTLGAPADSYFEYLVKLWVQGGRREVVYWERFASVVDGILDVASYTSSEGVTIVRDVLPSSDGNIRFSHKMDHFACYIPGMIVLGIEGLRKDETVRRRRWEWMAEQLTETCFKMYSKSPSGLSGEHIRLGSRDEWRMSGGYQLRPEAVEAFFYMFRYTGREKYRRYAWHVFEHIERHCRVGAGGYSAILSARSRNPRLQNVMHSFVIAETFKYLYLIFGDAEDELPLDKWVFNTEAHPLLVMPEMEGRGEGEVEGKGGDDGDDGGDGGDGSGWGGREDLVGDDEGVCAVGDSVKGSDDSSDSKQAEGTEEDHHDEL